MIPQTDTKPDGKPVEHQCDEKIGPAEEEKAATASTWKMTMMIAVSQLTVVVEYSGRTVALCVLNLTPVTTMSHHSSRSHAAGL